MGAKKPDGNDALEWASPADDETDTASESVSNMSEAVAFFERLPALVSQTREATKRATVATQVAADEARAVLNGAVGDRLEDEGSPLASGMQLRDAGEVVDVTRPLPLEDAQGRRRGGHLAVLVHGLMATDRYWTMGSDGAFAERLEREVGVCVVSARYNTGRHISQNGQALSEHLQLLVTHWPVEVESISLIGHSMGGLVCRSAALYGAQAAAAGAPSWFSKLKRQFLLGVPSRGAPLEMVAHVATVTLKHIPNPWTHLVGWAINQRSAGIKDLRHGYLVDEEWAGRDADAPSFGRKHPPTLPQGVDHYVIASTVAADVETPLGKLLGDALVVPWSAKDTVVHGESGEHLAAPVCLIPNLAHAQIGWSKRARDQVIAWWNEGS